MSDQNGHRAEVEPLPNMLGRHPAMQEVYRRVRRAATNDLPVLLVGETGTGKELLAKALYELTGPPGRPFEPVNCAAINEGLAEGELFGWEKGAFTGAAARRAGPLESANGGVLFLDEACSLSLHLQSKLLRALDAEAFRRVGGTEWVCSRFRLVTAVARPMKQLVAEGRWRVDFGHRVAGLVITLPPLRERRSDVELLARAFLSASANGGQPAELDEDAVAILRSYSWPGNVRELRMLLRRVVALTDGSVITAREVLAELPELAEGLDERTRLETVLRAHGWDVSKAARTLGMSRANLYLRLKKHELERTPAVPEHV